jgi:hypothetical protein
MVPNKPAPHLMRGVKRFPACAKLSHAPARQKDATAGEGRSEMIMLQS